MKTKIWLSQQQNIKIDLDNNTFWDWKNNNSRSCSTRTSENILKKLWAFLE